MNSWLDRNDTECSLFAYPAQCNFSGKRFPLNWIHAVHKKKSLVLLDAASFLSTSRLDLTKYPAGNRSFYQLDFIPISFYKLFGFPTGLGGTTSFMLALVVKKTSSVFIQKPYFGGGTITALGTSFHNTYST